jgi:hypothetical protein
MSGRKRDSLLNLLNRAGQECGSHREVVGQKTRKPERRGITRAVSPKKIGRRKKGNVDIQERPRK